MTPAFWRGKRVLVTGHTGFKGSWLALWLQSLGADVVGYALPPDANPSAFDVARVARGMVSVNGDIRDFGSVAKEFSRHQPDMVFHLAAQSLVRKSYDDPLDTVSTNVLGTANVLQAVRRCDCVRAVLIVTSDKCYENREWLWGYRENDPMGGHDPYSASKGCAELITAAFRNSFFRGAKTAVASVRAGNVIGGGDWSADRLVPDAIKAFADGRALDIRSPEAIRPWQHVLEPLAGYLALAEHLYDGGEAFAEAWNFGPLQAEAHSVADVVGRLAALWGASASWRATRGPHPHEAHRLGLDCSKALARLNWRPKFSLDQALLETVEWYRAWLAGDDMRRWTEGQIRRYQETLAA